MDTPEFKDMDVEYTRSPKEYDPKIEKVITASSAEKENEDPNNPIMTESNEPDSVGKKQKKKEGKLKKSERRLNNKYKKLKTNLTDWIDKREKAKDLFTKKETLAKDLRELIHRSVAMKESDKNIALLKKAMKGINEGLKDKKRIKKIKKKISRLEKKINRIENRNIPV
jgi:hypothetical protein